MIKPVIILLALLLSVPVFAQQARLSHIKKKPYRGEAWTLSNRASLKYTFTSLLDPYGALLPLGLEYYFDEKFGISFEGAMPLYYVLNNSRGSVWKKINSDYKLRVDARQYFRLREKRRYYFGAEVFFRRQNAALRNSSLHFLDGNCYPFDQVLLVKTTWGAGIFLGYSRKIGEQIIIEGHMGIGARALNATSSMDKSQVQPFRESNFRTLLPPNADRIGDKDINIYAPFAIKIGYLF